MNKKCALIKSLMQGDTINVSNSIRLTGYSNPAREIPREIERPFKVVVSRVKKESQDQFGNYVMWYDYHFDPHIDGNSEGVKEMCKYLLENDKSIHKSGVRTDRERRAENNRQKKPQKQQAATLFDSL